MTLHEYLETLKGKRVAVTGIGVSNQPLLRLLLEAGPGGLGAAGR